MPPESFPGANSSADAKHSFLISIAAVALLALLAVMLFASVRQESGLGDETMHLFGGYEYLKHADFGRNPEHPPFAKMLAALPLLPMNLQEPPQLPIPFFKGQDGANSSQFLYSQNAEAMLMRGRAMILLFSLCLGGLIFFAAREMFGMRTGLLALGLFAFEPVVLANGALITTDMPLACLFFATVYTFYRYLRTPSLARLLLCAVTCALTISTKHSGILILPTLVLLALGDVLVARSAYAGTSVRPASKSYRPQALAGALTVIVLSSYVALWAIYGFRYAARPGALEMVPSLAIYSLGLSPMQHALITFAAHYHVLPEAYLYGWVDVLLIPTRVGSFLLGHLYTAGHWFYLPVIFLIKTSFVLLALLLLVPFTRPLRRPREMLFLALPVALFTLFSAVSKINLGVRHLLPIYPFCFILAASAAVYVIDRYRFAWVGATAFLGFGVISSLHAFPDYLAFANEVFGGPSHIAHLAADSNADWGQGLKWTRQYLDHNPTSECWIAHESAPIVPAAYYGVPCKPLLNGFSRMIGSPVAPLPTTVSGMIFVGSTDLTGFHWGPGALNPYAAFRDGHPVAVLNNDIWVYQGTYNISLLSALNNALTAQLMLRQRQPAAALALAKAAADAFPQSADVQAVLGQSLMASGQPAEAAKALDKAIQLAHSDPTGYQFPLADELMHPGPHP